MSAYTLAALQSRFPRSVENLNFRMLHINDLTYRIEGRMLFDKATAALSDGWKVGLVGPNGAGKSTLLRLIREEIAPDDGSISVRKGRRLGWVAQEAPSDDRSLIDTVLAADRERADLLSEAESADDPARIAEIQTRLVDIDAHSAPARGAAILAGLGFPEPDQQRACREFSGGWRMRVALAAVLFSEPDLLLLDEPTNYLDLEGTMWLESYLRDYPYTVLIVSHDRELLNTSVNRILHLEAGKLAVYSGGYDQFERQRAARLSQQLAMKAKQEEQRRHMEKFVERFRAKASKAKQAQSRLKALSRMEPIASIAEQRTLPFHFPDPAPMSPPILRLAEADLGYAEGTPILKEVTLQIGNDDRIALLGPNGQGKSTLAKALSGRLAPLRGNLFKHKKLKIGYFAQHQIDELRPEASPYDHVRAAMPDATEAQVRTKTAVFGFGADKADTKAKNLSGGEKARLLFNLAAMQAPHLLILDEPTNHLDVDSRQALIQALNEYAGAVVLISHDPHLIAAAVDRLWLVRDGAVGVFDGSLDDYRSQITGVKASKSSASQDTDSRESAEDRKAARRGAAAARQALRPLKVKIETAEKEIQSLNAKLKKTDDALAEPGLFERDLERATTLSKQRSQIVDAVGEAENRWLMATEAFEAAQNGENEGDG